MSASLSKPVRSDKIFIGSTHVDCLMAKKVYVMVTWSRARDMFCQPMHFLQSAAWGLLPHAQRRIPFLPPPTLRSFQCFS